MINCLTCGKENEDFFKFCLGCGSELATVKAEAPAPLEPEPPAEWPLHNTSPEMEALSDSVIAQALANEEAESVEASVTEEPESKDDSYVESSAKLEFESFKGAQESSDSSGDADDSETPEASPDRANEAILMGGLPDPDDIVTVIRPALGSAATARQPGDGPPPALPRSPLENQLAGDGVSQG